MKEQGERKPRRRLTLADQLKKIDEQIKNGEDWLKVLRERRAEIVAEATKKAEADLAAVKAASGAAPF